MSLAAETGLFQETVTFKSRSSHDGKEFTHGSTTSYSARVELGTFPTHDSQGNQVSARGRCFIDMQAAPADDDILTLPAGYDPVEPPILRINPERDEDGAIDHVEIEFGWGKALSL